MFKIEDSKMPQTLMRFTKRYGAYSFYCASGKLKNRTKQKVIILTYAGVLIDERYKRNLVQPSHYKSLKRYT